MLQGRVVFTALFCFAFKNENDKILTICKISYNLNLLKIVSPNRLILNIYYLVIKLCCNKIEQKLYCALCKVFSKQKRLYFVIPIHLHSQIAVL